MSPSGDFRSKLVFRTAQDLHALQTANASNHGLLVVEKFDLDQIAETTLGLRAGFGRDFHPAGVHQNIHNIATLNQRRVAEQFGDQRLIRSDCLCRLTADHIFDILVKRGLAG